MLRVEVCVNGIVSYNMKRYLIAFNRFLEREKRIMDNAASIYILPALIALVVKLFLLFVSRNGSGRSSVFFTMVLLFACHNLAEVFGFLEFFKGVYSENILRWYYVMSLCSVSVILVYVLEISGIQAKFRGCSAVTIALALSLSLVVLLSDTVISGASSLGYIVTAVKGPQYWLFQVFFTVIYLLGVSVLIKGYMTAKDHLTGIQCGYTLLALLPVAIAAVSVVVLMSMGATINGAVIIPVCTTFFLLVIVKGELTHKLTDIRRHVPFSLERRTSGEIMDIFSRYAQDEINYRDCMAELEKLLVVHKHSKSRGNVTQTAASMDIPRSSLYSIFRRLGIEVKDQS
jgi:hypothetical protein